MDSPFHNDCSDIPSVTHIDPFSPEFDKFVEDSRSKIQVLKQQSSTLKQQLNAETDKAKQSQLQRQYDSVRKELKQTAKALKDEIEFKGCICRELDDVALDD